MEGVLTPEIWIAVAERTRIPELRRTTRDEPDYDKLMRYRLEILEQRGIGIRELQAAVNGSDPLPGALEFLDWLRGRWPLLILSDTFFDLASPLVRKLGSPAVFCHQLEVEASGRVVGYRLRMPEPLVRLCLKSPSRQQSSPFETAARERPPQGERILSFENNNRTSRPEAAPEERSVSKDFQRPSRRGFQWHTRLFGQSPARERVG